MTDQTNVGIWKAENQEGAALWQATQVNETARVPLGDLEAVARSATPSQLGGGRQGGMRENENCGGRWHRSADGGDHVP